MEIAVRLSLRGLRPALSTELADSSGEMSDLACLAAEVVSSWAALDQLLLLLLLSALRHVSLLAEAAGLYNDELSRPTAAAFARSPSELLACGVVLPSVGRLAEPSLSLIRKILSHPFSFERFCTGEAVVGCCMQPLRQVRWARAPSEL